MPQTGSSYTARLQQLPQFQGRDWNTIDPQEIQAALQQLIAQDQANLQRSQQHWGIADKAAMAAAISLLGYGGGQALGSLFGGGSGGAGASADVLPGAATINPTFPVDAALEGAAVPTAAAITGNATKPPAFATDGVNFDNAGTNNHAYGGGSGMNLRDWLSMGTGLAGLVGGAVQGHNNQNALQPNTLTSDPNIQKLLQTMQGRLDQSEPLYKSIMAMAKGLLPTQYQNGGGGGQ